MAARVLAYAAVYGCAYHSLRLGIPASGKTTCSVLQADRVSSRYHCRTTVFGVDNGDVIATSFGSTPDPDGPMAFVYHIDGYGHEIVPFYGQPVLAGFLFVIGSAVFLGRGRPSPGKLLSGLRLRGRGCAMCREVRRGRPLLLGAVLTVVVQIGPIPAGLTLLGLGGSLLSILMLWGWPMIRWRGTMPYDRATGFEVVRAARA